MSTFDLRQALRNLDIEVKPFGYQGEGLPELPEEEGLRGYSMDRWLAINPEERWPEFVTFHEMTHILRDHQNEAYRKFDIDVMPYRKAVLGLRTPSWKEKRKYNELNNYLYRVHDIKETECHVTAILTAQLTDTPFDLQRELDQLRDCYTGGRKIPESVIKQAKKTAKEIYEAGKVQSYRNERSYSYGAVSA